MTVIKDLSKASSEEMHALQQKELEILKYFKKICNQNHLMFFWGGGTSIGALRHQGFIPWDDDIDVFMPREDYEKLYSNWDKYVLTSQYSLCRSDETHNYRHAAMTINDNYTTFINFRTKNEDVNQGISIDIIPMDYLADHFWTRIWQRVNAILFSLFINQRLPDNQGKLLRWLSAFPLFLIKNSHLRYKIWSSCEKRMLQYSKPGTKKMVELVTGMRTLHRPLNPEWFSDTIDMKFENTEMPMPIGYDGYLSLVFGDYMSLPPMKDRKAKHHTVFIDTETAYLKYKGKYYLTN